MKKIYWVLADNFGNIDHELDKPLIFCSRKKAIERKRENPKYYSCVHPIKCEINLTPPIKWRETN